MTLTADAIAKIEELARQKEITSNDRHYVPQGYSEVKDPEFPTLDVNTLEALAEYLLNDVDAVLERAPFVHVESASRVRVVMPTSDDRTRHEPLRARYRSPLGSNGGRTVTLGFVPLELGLIQLQTFFEDAGDRADVLKILGNVRDEAIRTQADDGVTQTVTARAGITVVEDVEVPRVVHLVPFRTFPEVDQPASPFVLRLKKGQAGIEVALLAADNGLWELEAIASIGAWLADRLEGTATFILA